MPMSIFPRPDARLLAVVAAAGLVLGTLTDAGLFFTADRPVPRPASPLPALSRGGTAPSPLTSLQEGEALRRPLFVASRRAPPKPPDPARPSELVPDLAVTGIIAGATGGVATGMDKRSQIPFALRTGDAVGDWHIDAISRETVRLKRDDRTRDYPLALPPPPPKAPPRHE